MKHIGELVRFRKDLFFEGAIQINWFEVDHEKRDKAAANFVFHGPKYHGVSKDDIQNSETYSLIDTVSMTHKLLQSIDHSDSDSSPFALAIAGYGTGKSHFGLTLATLFSDYLSDIAKTILKNLEAADSNIGQIISRTIYAWSHPELVLAINGMENFDLASELSRQALAQLRRAGCDTTALNELWPRFMLAEQFVVRNYDLRRKEFADRFGNDATSEEITKRLQDHDDLAFQAVNEIFQIANGNPIKAIGFESPQQLIRTICEVYCGDEGPFRGVFIIFDEFGRFLEFAAERPHIAGDAALQQLFEAVQDNAEKCFLLCFSQFELKTYLSRISKDKQIAIQRYITRYDSATKYFLSTNLETLFASLIEKKDSQYLLNYLFSSDTNDWRETYDLIKRWFPLAERSSVWRDWVHFKKVIIEGCWPLSPFATWMLSRFTDSLQHRSAITLLAQAMERASNFSIDEEDSAFTISAVDLCGNELIEELLATEEFGRSSSIAHAYLSVQQKYGDNYKDIELNMLKSIMIASKLGLKVRNQQEMNVALGLLSNLPQSTVSKALRDLINEYAVIEWNDRFCQYEILGDSIPRSHFVAFLRSRTQDTQYTIDRISEIFAAYMKNWAELEPIDPSFAANKNINTMEWQFQTNCSNLLRLNTDIKNAFTDWKEAYRTDDFRGQIIYCYVPPDYSLEQVTKSVKNMLSDILNEAVPSHICPILVVLLEDKAGLLKQAMLEYWILSETLSDEEKQRYSHFIDSHKQKALEDIKQILSELVRNHNYILPKGFQISDDLRIAKLAYQLFDQTYPKIIPFPFDGFSTAKGNAAKDCRDITVELFKGKLNQEWITSRPSQTQNRAIKLLQKGTTSWGVLDENGEPLLFPINPKLKDIIREIDRNLKEKESQNLLELLENLIFPPYGCNIASAAIIIGVFLAPRINKIALFFNNEITSPTLWVNQALAGNYLDLKALSQTKIAYISEEGAGEWEDLLSRWDSENTHQGRLHCFQEAAKLRQRVSLPAGFLFERFRRLQQETQHSINALKEHEDFYDQQLKYIESAYSRQEAGNLSRVSYNLLKRLNEMNNEAELWTAEQIDEIRILYERAKESLIQFFQPWLTQQRCLSAVQLSAFTMKLKGLIARNLKALGLTDLAGKVVEHVDQITRNIEELQSLQYIVQQTRAFLDGHRVSEHITIAELNEWKKTCENLIENVGQARRTKDIPKLNSVSMDAIAFSRKCTEQIKSHKERLSRLMEFSITSIDDVKKAKSEIKDLLRIFAGDDLNIEDLTKMDAELVEIDKDCEAWSDLNLTNEEIKDLVSARILNIRKNADCDEYIWLTEDVYSSLLEGLLSKRNKLSKQWLQPILELAESIETMSAEDCTRLITRLSSLPTYLEKADIETAMVIRKKVDSRLDGLQIEGLFARFKQMPQNLQMKFFKIIKKHLTIKDESSAG